MDNKVLVVVSLVLAITTAPVMAESSSSSVEAHENARYGRVTGNMAHFHKLFNIATHSGAMLETLENGFGSNDSSRHKPMAVPADPHMTLTLCATGDTCQKVKIPGDEGVIQEILQASP